MSDTVDLTALTKLGKKINAAKKTWTPLDFDALHPGTYLAADQSISAFGLVLLEVPGSPARNTTVHMAKTFKTVETEFGGHEDTLTRAEDIQEQLAAWLDEWVFRTDWGYLLAVHEAPPIGGGKLRDPAVSLVTSYAFRRATKTLPRLPMVQKQAHAALICGDRYAKKPVHHAALKELYPQIHGTDWVTNEATRDALSVALYAAHRGY